MGEKWPVNLVCDSDFHVIVGFFKVCWGFFRPKNPKASAGFEPANLGTRDQDANIANLGKVLQWTVFLVPTELWDGEIIAMSFH
jgi:hypothetical protein